MLSTNKTICSGLPLGSGKLSGISSFPSWIIFTISSSVQVIKNNFIMILNVQVFKNICCLAAKGPPKCDHRGHFSNIHICHAPWPMAHCIFKNLPKQGLMQLNVFWLWVVLSSALYRDRRLQNAAFAYFSEQMHHQTLIWSSVCLYSPITRSSNELVCIRNL